MVVEVLAWLEQSRRRTSRMSRVWQVTLVESSLLSGADRTVLRVACSLQQDWARSAQMQGHVQVVVQEVLRWEVACSSRSLRL